VGRTLDANKLLARSACGKRHRGRPLNSVVRHMPGQAWFKQWEFEYDRDSTTTVYSNMAASASEACGCGNCLEWMKIREAAFTPEVRRLFVKVGVDLARETSISGLMLRDGEISSYLFLGTYHFFGRLLAGPQSHVPIPGGGYKIENMSVDPRLRIGLSSVPDTNPDVPREFRDVGVITVTFACGALDEAYA
jgi:hypothetical protein